jgi:dienelactone hydrolase
LELGRGQFSYPTPNRDDEVLVAEAIEESPFGVPMDRHASSNSGAKSSTAVVKPSDSRSSGATGLATRRNSTKRGWIMAGAAVAAVLGVVGVGVFIVGLLLSNVLSPATSVESQTPFDLTTPPLPPMPQRPPFGTLSPGVEFAEVRLPVFDGPGRANRLFVYLPSGNHAPKSLGCVFIAPAGATVFSGMTLGEGDQPEHIPYVQAGLAVIAYEIDGELGEDDESDEGISAAYTEYKESHAGLINARNAIEFAITQMPEVDPQRLYTAGHSSAGRQALLLAEHEPRIRGVVAYNAVTDVVDDLGIMIVALEGAMPGLREFLTRSSPVTHVARLQCAVRIFHSEGDDRVEVSQAREFFSQLPPLAQPRDLHIVPGGDHYSPMIEQGIPAAIPWLLEIDQRLGGTILSPQRYQSDAGAASTPEFIPSKVTKPTATTDSLPFELLQASPESITPSPQPPIALSPPPASSPPPAPERSHHLSRRISIAAVSDVGGLAAWGDMAGGVHVWEITSNREIATWQVFERGWTERIALSEEGLLAIGGGFPRATALWNIKSQQPVAVLDGHTAADALAFSPDGSQVVAGFNRSVRLFDANDGRELRRWSREGSPTTVCFSNDGAYLATGWRDGAIVVYAVDNAAPHIEFHPHVSTVVGASFSLDAGRLLSCSRDGRLIFSDLSTGAFVWEATTPCDDVAVLPGGQRAVTARRGVLEVWDLRTGERLSEETPHARLLEFAFSRNGAIGVSFRMGGIDQEPLRIWNAPQVRSP